MYIDPFFANMINFVILILILLIGSIILIGSLRFFRLYTHQSTHTSSTFSNTLEIHSTSTSTDPKESNNLILDYIKRNFIEGSESSNEQPLQ